MLKTRNAALAALVVVTASCGPCDHSADQCPPPPRNWSRRAEGGFDLSFPHHPSELLAGLAQPAEPGQEPELETERRKLYRRLEIRPVDFLPRIRVAVLRVRAPGGDEELVRAAREIEAHPELFEYVEPNSCVYLEHPGSPDPLRSQQWALDRVDAAGAWGETPGSSQVTVAVLDSGIATFHPDFLDRMWDNPCEKPNGIDDPCSNESSKGKADDLHGWNFVDNSADLEDSLGHGSQTAGIIGAVHDNGECIQGMNKDVSLMVLKVSEKDTGHVTNIEKALLYAIDSEADVVNASWSTDYEESLLRALQAAGEAGIVVAAAAGHGGIAVDLDTNPSYPCSYQLPNVICVAATTRVDEQGEEDELQADSSWGKQTVHLGAPGEGIYAPTLGNLCHSKSGPSMAAPHVAGVAALIRSKCPAASVKEIVDRIVSGADSASALAQVTVSGGRLDAAQALDADCAPP